MYVPRLRLPGKGGCDRICIMEYIDSDRIIAALERVRVPAMPGEYDLHGMIGAALDEAGLEYGHEYRLAPRCRLDFMCAGVAIEVKKGRPNAADLVKQLSRYMEHAEVREMVVVVQKRVRLPETICGKRVRQVALNMLWGVALP